MGINSEAGRQRSRVGQRIAGSRRGEITGDVEREGVAVISALIGDGGHGRPTIGNGQIEALADRLAMGGGGRDRERVAGGNGGDCERTILFGPGRSVRSEGFDELITAILVKYIVFKSIGRKKNPAV